MDAQVIYNVPHQIPFGWAIALYFFFTGLSAGSFLTSVLVRLMGLTAYNRLGRIAALLAPVLIIVAPVFLVADLEQPLRFYRVLIYQNATSPISYGAYFLPLYGICTVLYAYFQLRDEKLTRFFTWLGLPLAVALEAYTGFILGIVRSRELWNSALMPVLFLVSALVSGIALVIFCSILFDRAHAVENKELHAGLGRLLGGVVLVDLFMVLSEVLVLAAGKAEAKAAVQVLLSGSFAPYFLGVEVLAGGILPLLVLFNRKLSKQIGWQAVASLLVLVGVLAMRFVLVLGGQQIPLS